MSRKLPGAEEILLGFDARERFLAPDTLWDAARRGTYLLRSDARKPLSVDSMVWPSLFGDGLPNHERQRIGLNTLPLPEWRGPNGGLWDDLARMQEALGPLASEAHWTVAVSRVSADGFSEPSSPMGPPREELTPPGMLDDWKLLGFDVADAGLLSGLSNCGYRQSEAAGLRDVWAPDLNAHHLFEDVEKALMFRDLTDRRVPEHAPFFVYALYLVADPSQTG